VMGFLIGGLVWFSVPFCMATTNGLAGRALTTHPELGPLYIDAGASGSGLTPARVLSHILGDGGSFLLLLQLFMAVTSTGSAEIIAVSSILTYDVYYEYLNPELKQRREQLRRIFYTEVQRYTGQGGLVDLMANPAQEQVVRLAQSALSLPLSAVQGLVDALGGAGFFQTQPTEAEQQKLSEALGFLAAQSGGSVIVGDLYSAMNRAVSSNNIEGMILLRISKFFTGIFAVFMGFLAVLLQALGLNLGWVYMSMGVVIGSAVGPASLTILMERAKGRYIGLGAVGGFVLGISSWAIKAQVDEGEVTIGTLGMDWPWVVGNVCAILGGGLIAFVGSLVDPDTEFRWAMLNDRIALVDDVEPPKDDQETEEKLEFQVKVAWIAAWTLTIIMLVLWPLPMHYATGVFGEGNFAAWVAVEMIWAIIGGAVIIILPLIELMQSFRLVGKDKTLAAEKAMLAVQPQLKVSVQVKGAPAAAASGARYAPSEASTVDHTPVTPPRGKIIV